MSERSIQVEPDPRGRWLVTLAPDGEALSEHGSVTEAERVARRQAADRGQERILIRDRYGRVRHAAVHGQARLA